MKRLFAFYFKLMTLKIGEEKKKFHKIEIDKQLIFYYTLKWTFQKPV